MTISVDPIEEANLSVYEEVALMFRSFAGSGLLVVDTSRSGPCPELRVGPFNCACGAHPWAIVKNSDGFREVIDWKESMVIIGMDPSPTHRIAMAVPLE